MPNSVAPAGKTRLLTAGDWVAGSFDVMLVDNQTFTYVEGTHTVRSDIPAIERIATVALAGKSVVDGVLGANDVVFPAVSGDQFEYVIIVENTGAEANDTIIAVFDTATGLPLTPNGNDINLAWNASGIVAF